VREEVFPTEVLSDGIDYRFEHEGNEYRTTTLPPAIAQLCREVAMQEGLLLAGFDFRVTADERWYCLEVNPVPTFLPYEMSTGQPIGNTLLDALIA
jgi:glutathione synthase/RimK-type ligase-like ATP-grasp enzyme